MARRERKSQNPSDNGSDIFGFLLRSAVIFADDPRWQEAGSLSSPIMRHVRAGI